MSPEPEIKDNYTDEGGTPLLSIHAVAPDRKEGIVLVGSAGWQIEASVERIEAEVEAARCRGILGLLQLRYAAWLEEKIKGPAVRKMQARQAILAEQCRTAEAEIRLRETVRTGKLHALGLSCPPRGLPPRPVPLGAQDTDEQVEAVALRCFLQGVESEEDWLTHKGGLEGHLSPYGVEEVGQRLREMWRIHRQARG